MLSRVLTDEMPTKTDADRTDFYKRLDPHSIAALWTRLGSLVPPEPKMVGVPHRWEYAALRPLLMESARLISAKEAERRVLLLENPDLLGTSRIAATLYAGLQLILPGETAPAHRHSQSAFRFIVEGSGAYTAVGGERAMMEPGDFVVTPAWTWHDHGHKGGDPMVWLDGLDIPIVAAFNATFGEHYEGETAPVTRPIGDSLARYGCGLLPIGYVAPSLNSPVFSYPYSRTREILHTISKGADPDSHEAYRMRYANPIDGGWAMPTLSAMIGFVPKGFQTAAYRCTASTVYLGVEGEGAIGVRDNVLTLRKGDIVVIPGWVPYSINAISDCILFSFSDRVAQEKLGFFREQRL